MIATSTDGRHPAPLPRVGTTILVGTIARVLVAASTGLGIDESYAVAVNRPLSLSYFDHPPLAFWLSAAAEALTGSRAPAVVRLPFIACFALTLLVLAKVTRRQFGEVAARGAVLAASLGGVIGVTGATWVLPDGPLFLGLALGTWGAVVALLPSSDGRHVADPRGWWLVGLGAGLAALAKYHAIFLPLGLLAFLITARRLDVLASWRLWAAAAIAGTAALPVVLWNAAHGWASFRFQSARAAPNAAWSPAPVLENLAGQAAWVLPWIWVPLVWVGWRAWRRGPHAVSSWLFWCVAAGPLLAFTGSALLGRRGLPHWQAPGYLLLTPLLGAAVSDALAAGRRWPLVWWRGATAATVATGLLLASQTATGWLTIPPHADPTRDAVPWDAGADLWRMAHAIDVTHWMDGAKLGAAAGAAAPLRVLADDARHFAFRPAIAESTSALVVRSAARGPIPEAMQRRLGPLDTLPPVLIRRRDVVVETLYVYRRAQRPGA